jgi:hypothetical protein
VTLKARALPNTVVAQQVLAKVDHATASYQRDVRIKVAFITRRESSWLLFN